MKLSDINKMSKDELQKYLGDSAPANTSRADLIEAARNKFENEKNTTNKVVEDLTEIINNDTLQAQPLPTADRQNYILSLFEKDELVDGKYPNCDGLRRVFEEVIGTILQVDIVPIQCVDKDSQRATVKCGIVYIDKRDNAQKYRSDVADSHYSNTKDPYRRHLTATAATVAEARVYRKVLGLKGLAVEEMQAPEGDDKVLAEQMMRDENLAGDTQKNVIEKMCQRMGIDVNKLLTETKGVETTDFTKITNTEAIILIRTLNNYQKDTNKGGVNIPTTILKDTTSHADTQTTQK